MGFPASVLQEGLAGTLPDVDRPALGRLSSAWKSLFDEVRRERPGEDTSEESKALSRFASLGLEALRVLGAGWIGVFRGGLNAALRELLAKELDAADTERKFALRQIEQAAHTFGVLVESVAVLVGALPPAEVRSWLDKTLEGAQREPLVTADDRLVVRFQLDLLVALESLDAPLDELTFWAFRAAMGARRVEALPSPTVSGLRGEIVRLRSQRAWLNWDAAEIRRELEPWPLVPSR